MVTTACADKSITAPANTVAVSQPQTNVGEGVTDPASTFEDSALATLGTLPEITDVGVPGLDSSDPFCAAWSRFAGSFGVVAPVASFDPDPWRIELFAAPTMVAAHTAMAESWPDAIADMRVTVLDDSLGPLAQRMQRNQEYLVASGASPQMLADIGATWETQVLTAPDSVTAAMDLVLPDDQMTVINAATMLAVANEPEFVQDSRLQTESVPAFLTYLQANCPDQGTLAGQDVPGPTDVVATFVDVDSSVPPESSP